MPTLILIHLGDQWPHYLKDCLLQARLTNPIGQADIYVVVNQCHSERCEEFQSLGLKIIFVETLCASEKHREFVHCIQPMVDLHFRKSYWQYVFERFFVLEMVCQQRVLEKVYMIETDNLLYVPLKLVEQTESYFQQDMALPFDNLDQGYPSIVFFRNTRALSSFTYYMLSTLTRGYLSDMKIVAKYRFENPELIFAYPVLPHSCNDPPRDRFSLIGHRASAQETLFLTNSQFPILFDAIAYGQALSGIDPRNTEGKNSIGYINESALYSIHETSIAWLQFKSLWFPLVNKIPLVNLHIHSKSLSSFLSNRITMPSAEYNPKELEEILHNDLKAKSGLIKIEAKV